MSDLEKTMQRMSKQLEKAVRKIDADNKPYRDAAKKSVAKSVADIKSGKRNPIVEMFDNATKKKSGGAVMKARGGTFKGTF
jgi:hypothetical protein